MFPVDSPLTDNGLIQLWCLGQVTNEMDRLPKLRLALGIAHQFGCIRALQWCPSGVWEAGKEEKVNYKERERKGKGGEREVSRKVTNRQKQKYKKAKEV